MKGRIFVTLFALPFVVGEGFGIYVLGESLGFGFVLLLLTVIGTNYAFYNWLKAPTRAGRKLLDKLHGFKMYLEVAEKDELNLRNPPQKTPALFEVYLPFAMALDVEQVWAEKFAAVFQGLAAQGQRYAPAWYHGDHWDIMVPNRRGRIANGARDGIAVHLRHLAIHKDQIKGMVGQSPDGLSSGGHGIGAVAQRP